MKTISLLALLTLSTSGCLLGDPGAGTSDEDILGGTADSGDPSVVALRYSTWQGSSLCTATVIAPKLLLTAAHCTDGYSYQFNNAQNVNWTVRPGTGWTDASFVFANPAYDGNATHGHDVAVVVLSSATTLAPIAIGPDPAAASTLKAVGYGLTQKGTSGPAGAKLQNTFSVSSVAAHEFVGGPEATCHGDSGGPVFNADGSLAGTTSYGDTADCNGNDHFVLLSDNRAWIDSMISTYGGGATSGGGSGGGGGGGGNVSQCSVQSNVNGLAKKVSCTNGTCQCYLNNSLLNTCAENASACGAGNCCGL